MSHTSKIEIQIKAEHISTLLRAFKTLGWENTENATMRTYKGRSSERYQYVAINPDKVQQAYDVGMTINGGTNDIEFFTDYYGGSVAHTLGEDMCNLRQEFVAQTALESLPNVISSSRKVLANGELELVVDVA